MEAKTSSNPYAASASSYQNKIAVPQKESTATKPTGWADWASISTVQADLQDGMVARRRVGRWSHVSAELIWL
jgi:hypothetical protein